ncbi:hypothetical protein [Paenibacillus sp. KN14-4R]|uniref:hypothetical protein n=1 Tax=Paenibacillus sp. KN14-4R TaxID=3445773 RepID=UPI003F9F5BB8
MKPNFIDMGMAISMGPKLRKEVEMQLIKDLKRYQTINDELLFDWSASCVEGKCVSYRDGSIDRFSGIMIYNADDELVADGWMEFVYKIEADQLVIYWEYLSIYLNGEEVSLKSNKGIPKHIEDIL